MRTFRKQRAANDPTKLAEFHQAHEDLRLAAKCFEQLLVSSVYVRSTSALATQRVAECFVQLAVMILCACFAAAIELAAERS